MCIHTTEETEGIYSQGNNNKSSIKKEQDASGKYKMKNEAKMLISVYDWMVPSFIQT